MAKNIQGNIATGIFITCTVVAVILFIPGNVKISIVIIVIGIVVPGLIFASRKSKQDRSELRLDHREVAQFKKMLSKKTSKELKALYAQRIADNYRPEAIEAIRQILVERMKVR